MPAHQGKFVAYFRVSTDKQGKSGLGLDAQREAVLTTWTEAGGHCCRDLSKSRVGSATTDQSWRRL
jgi:DNA invertase Pin-like site-specific DNA recombinase